MFFVMIFAATFNLTNSRENDNESNTLIEKLLDAEQFDENMDVNRACFDSPQSINQNVTLDDKIYLDMNSMISEEEEFTYYENKAIDYLPQNIYNNENHENAYDDDESRRDIEEALRHPCVLDAINQYEQSLSSNNANFCIEGESLINYNDKVTQEHPSDCNTTSMHNNILSENYSITSCNLPSTTSSEINSKGKNELIENSYLTSSKILYDQEKSIFISNMQNQHYIDHKDSALINTITLDDIQLLEIPDLTLYKDYLKSLSMKNNYISSITKIIDKLTSLKKLDLSHNRIDIIDCKIENMKLEWLDLSSNYLIYSICEPIFKMTTLKYLNLQDNDIGVIIKFNSKGLLSLNISNNPVELIEEDFYELPNIVELFMFNLNVKKSIYFDKILPNLKVLDLSHNKSTLSVYNIEILTILEEINLSNCELTNFKISSKMLNLKKLILFNNNIQFLPIGFKKLKCNIEILDLRDNPLEIITTKRYIGALGLLVHFYGRILLDKSILKDIQKLSFDQIYSQTYKKDLVYFQKQQKNIIDDEFYINIRSLIEESDSQELKNKVEKVIKLIEEIRDSGFMDFGKIIKVIMNILKRSDYKSIIIKRSFIYLNTKFSSKFYRFLKGILFNYKLKNLKSALNHIYNSDEHLNYWMYHLRDILSFTGIEKIEVNYKIHNDKNIILGSFINIADPGKLIHIIKLELDKDKEMEKIFLNLLYNTKERCIIPSTNSTLKQIEEFKHNGIKYILKKYQIIDKYQ